MQFFPALRCPTVQLFNGLEIPVLGLVVHWRHRERVLFCRQHCSEEEEMEPVNKANKYIGPKQFLGSILIQNCTSHRGGYSHDAILYALTECGIRHLDTAKRYGCEKKLGKAIKESGLQRSELWLTNKLWPGDYGYKAAKEACLDSCTAMGVEYFDLYLMHWPEPFKPGGSNREIRADTWKALEDLYKEGICRAIGVSNFVVHHLEQLKEDCSVVPHVNQVEYHPFQQPKHLMEYCRNNGIVFEGFSPLAKGQALSDPVVQQIAKKHGGTTAQICLRWSIQNGVVTIPKSIKKNRIQENCQVFGFQLDEEDMVALGNLHDGQHISWDPTNVD